MSHQFISEIRPLRTIPESAKDKDYHRKFARWAIGSCIFSQRYRRYLHNGTINWHFFRGGDGQWILEEDYKTFFTDEASNSRDRIQMSINMIKPIVNYFVGSASTMNFATKVDTLNDGIKSALIEKINKMMFLHDVIEQNPDMEGSIRRSFGLGQDREESAEMAQLEPDDELKDAWQSLLNSMENFDAKPKEERVRIARYLSIFGLGVLFTSPRGSRVKRSVVEPWKYIWDTGATLPDLSDAMFMGHIEMLDLPQILELASDVDIDKDALERRLRDNQTLYAEYSSMLRAFYGAGNNNKIPVYFLRWRDICTRDFGYVKDEYGFIVLAEIGNKYKKKDLVSKDQLTEAQLKRTGGGVVSIEFEVMRRCTMITTEDLPTKSGKDTVLDYGMDEYEVVDPLNPSDVEFPYSVYTWTMEDGYVLTPIDDAISPQRMINRVASVQESHFNNSIPAITGIQKESIDPASGDESDVMSRIASGKPVTLLGRGMGINQAITHQSSTFGQSINPMEVVVSSLKQSINQQIGINEAMKGAEDPNRMLVGVANELINRGSVLQEPMFHAISQIMIDGSKKMLSIGKWFYHDHPERLSIMAGDKYGLIMSHIENMKLEDCRLVIERDQDNRNNQRAADELVMLLLSTQQIDSVTASTLMGKSTLDRVVREWSIYAKKMQIAQQQASQAQQQRVDQEAQMAADLQTAEAERKSAETAGNIQLKDKQLNLDFEKSRERNATSLARNS